MKRTKFTLLIFSFSFIIFLSPLLLFAEDGSQLWLRYQSETHFKAKVTSKEKSPAITIAIRELENSWQGQPIEFSLDKRQKHLKDGYQIKGDKDKITITAQKDVGLLYGAYHLLRLQLTEADRTNMNIEEIPAYDVRILNHWDNLNRTVERGYAGYSIWKWNELPNTLSPRYEAYARANASIGINATVLNNVNATPEILTDAYLEKVKALADIFRSYGMKVYLAVNFSSPKELGGLSDSDPLNPAVSKWWNSKVKEIYSLIPDFGGFLVKANSEGLPGPQDYGRTHADGANMLADALKPYGGIVMWRAFVYNPSDEDRAKQAYLEFVPLDAQFRDNVIIQIKNGPVDFQPREPFSPLFGALRKTPEMVEFQITQEYLGFSNHLVYLSPLFKETLDSDTYSDGEGSTIAKITDGTLRPNKVTAISAVANIGEDTNWCGHHFAQANWYAFGRLAWNHQLTSEQIADEWIKMTFSNNKDFIDPVKDMMLTSRETAVDYMMPLGLHHIFAFDHHYGPEPWGDVPGARPDWMPWYYHNADSTGLGFDRTMNGSNAVSQYFPPLNNIYNDIKLCPENLLLWFHHVPWDYRMKDGKTLWEALCYKYDSGVQQVRTYQKLWDKMEPFVDEQRFREVQSKLRIQARDAVWWKDACLLYFQTFSKRPIPYDIERPVHELEYLKKIKLDMKHHN
ncbi:alpha-glucuronidase family glycosyl hydrolase [uncultured Dysgonomonas sp.]|uniref:Xylan alpha-1,2-glucuronidase n=1 Tax=uncultured Dysgonomonas sp. TaxID=206096 RepID=A0A212JE47_9BACT|nr:alpha-glucuronidase family glycosyl hydrolase [uncultured Dysgonomonas sp.]SBV97699.1 Extracellular xylan exo-alpha-(1->2)-glucuronosidase [uncultured Dysgonomonas sp.]